MANNAIQIMLSLQQLLACCVFISTSVCESDTGRINDVPTVYYKEHQIRTDQLCPDLQEAATGRDIDTANHPYKSVFKLAEQVWRTADPCVFEARGPRNIITTVVIKAIQAENQPWNYSGAQPCPEHIKLRIPVSRRIFTRQRLPLCTVQKPPNPGKLFQGPYYNPHVWQLSNRKMGLSFALYENESLPQDPKYDEDNGGDNEINEITQSNNLFIVNNAKLPKFVHIVFSSFIGDTCSLRVQQYILDPTRKQCNGSVGRIYALCGMYTCAEEERVLRQAGFWMDDATHLSEKYKLIDFLRSKQFRHPSETSLLDFFLNLMRLMIMPMVFFVAYYVTRQLREKLANRQLQLQARSTSQPNISSGRDITSGSRIGVTSSVVVDSPTSSRRSRFEEPPPPYESIMTPPSYVEATSHKVEILSPSTSFPGGRHNLNILQVQTEADSIIPPSDIDVPTTGANIIVSSLTEPNSVSNNNDIEENHDIDIDHDVVRGESSPFEPTPTPWAIPKTAEQEPQESGSEINEITEIITPSQSNLNLPSSTSMTRIENITEQI